MPERWLFPRLSCNCCGDHGHVLVVDVWQTAWYEEREDTKIAERWFHLDSTIGKKATEEIFALKSSGRIHGPGDPSESYRNARILCEGWLGPPSPKTNEHLGKSHE